MGSRLQTIRQEARRSLHQEMSRPALLIIGEDDPVDVTVRVHERHAFTGDISGLETARFHDVETYIRFSLDELDSVPPRNAIISLAEGEAYRLGEAADSHGITQDVAATRLSDADATGLPVPTS